MRENDAQMLEQTIQHRCDSVRKNRLSLYEFKRRSGRCSGSRSLNGIRQSCHGERSLPSNSDRDGHRLSWLRVRVRNRRIGPAFPRFVSLKRGASISGYPCPANRGQMYGHFLTRHLHAHIVGRRVRRIIDGHINVRPSARRIDSHLPRRDNQTLYIFDRHQSRYINGLIFTIRLRIGTGNTQY